MNDWKLTCRDCACHDCSQRDNYASCGCDGICTDDIEYFVEDCDDYEVGWD